jgi:hypothetical protein
MNIYVFNDGKRYRAENAQNLVTALREDPKSLDKAVDNKTYMLYASERLLMFHHVIRFDTPEHFVSDLLKCGLIVSAEFAN